MPKRFTATEKWTDPWFCSLTDNEKLFWLYLLDNCNHAGIWEPNWFMFSVYVKNFKFNPDHFKDRIVVIGKKWHIPKFIEFQYGVLRPDCPAHKSVITLLEKERVSEQLPNPLLRVQDMVKDMDKAKVKVIGELHKDKDKYILPEWVDAKTWQDFKDMRYKIRKPMTQRAIELTIQALERLRTQGNDPMLVLEQSIQKSWQGVFELKPDFSKGKVSGCAPIPGKYDGLGEKA